MGRVKNVPGYNTTVFKGKDDQRALVQADVDAKVVLLFCSSLRALTKMFVQGLHPA
jgi:hypothetical protein